MAEYNPSKIIKDGNTYNFRDTTKIPLAGSNEISGSLIPNTDGTVNLGSPSYQWNNAYIKSLTINGVVCGDILTHNVSEFVNVTGAQTIGGVKTFSSNVIIQGSKKVTCNLDNSFIELDGGTTWGKGGSIVLSGQDRSSYTNSVLIVSKSDTNTDILQYQNGELKPLSNNTNNSSLGTPTNKWSKVYSDDVVHTTGDETVGGSKIFSDASTGVGKDVYHFATIPYGKNTPPATASTQYINFSGNTASQGFANGWISGYIEQTVQPNGGTRCRWLIRNTDEKNASVELLAAVNTLTFRPSVDNTMLLGLPSHAWKSVYSNAYYLGSTAFGDIVIHNSNEFVPVTGGAVITNYFLGRSVDTENLMISGGTSWSSGGSLETFGSNHSSHAGQVRLQPATSGSNFKTMNLEPSGTWSWSGTACQITSDQRLKQQITEIDDKLLDAWEDVELVQFKYNESVDTKGKSARLHTGYVVQQIDSACKSHGVDISEYGLYCHEEYPEETKEVEVEQADGTKTKETKVIREANEHYSLRYTEALIVECKYLRRCIARLTARIEELEKGNDNK